MLNRVLILVMILGVLLAFIGIGIDYLLPGTSPGMNLPQLLIIAFGLTISVGAAIVRQALLCGRQPRIFKTGLGIGLLITIGTLVLLEFVLSVFGLPTYFPAEVPSLDVKPAYWRTCDDLGCHYTDVADHPDCTADIVTNRMCIANTQGFHDSDEFVAQTDVAEGFRILMLGDSFAFGLSAGIGKSYVDTVEAALPDAIVWNVAVSGSGTNQDVVAFDQVGPLLQPQLSILGFFMNDFRDNLYPPDRLILLEDADGNAYLVERFRYDRWGNPVELPLDLVYAYLAEGYLPPTSELERMIGLTRLGTLVLRTLDLVTDLPNDRSPEAQTRVTRKYLAQLRDTVHELDSTLLVFLIPRREHIGAPGEQYLVAIELMEELEIPYLNPIHLFDPHEDYAPEPDIHWNNAGHQKAGDYLVECIAVFIASGDLADCDNVVIP